MGKYDGTLKGNALTTGAEQFHLSTQFLGFYWLWNFDRLVAQKEQTYAQKQLEREEKSGSGRKQFLSASAQLKPM